MFFLCGSIVLLLLDVLSNPQVRLSSDTLFAWTPTNEVVVEGLNLSTPVISLTPTSPPSGTDEDLPNREVAYVIQVIDGDTIEVFLNDATHRVRYIGIDSPEIGMPNYDEATEANRRLLEGQIVELERDITEIDQYGRLLRYVYLQNGLLVNSELVKLGCALAVAYPPDVK